jgi:competence protein ComEC
MKKHIIALVIILPFLVSFSFAAEEYRINFIDVGDSGDAVLIQSSHNNALIDCGGLLFGHRLVEFLKNNKVGQLDYLIISHPHIDHMGGAFFILPELTIKDIFDNGENLDDNDDVYRWYRKLIRGKNNYHILKAGDTLKMDDMLLEVIWPEEPNETPSFNANSLVVMLKYKNFRCLLTGDLNNIGEKKLLGKGADLKTDILKVGHHGYFDATSPQFLNAAATRYAIISVDKDNIRGAPSRQTLELLKGKGISILRTDINGTIVISVDKNGKFIVITER